jgi:hypothetical protein
MKNEPDEIDPDEKDAVALCQYFRDNPVNPRLRKRRPNGRGERKARKLGESGQQSLPGLEPKTCPYHSIPVSECGCLSGD